MKNFASARMAASLLLLCAAVLLTGCGDRPYKTTVDQFAGRPVPPSQLTQRVLVGIANASTAGTSALEILDAKRDIRFNVYQPNSTFPVSGFSANAAVVNIFNFPEQTSGVVYTADGTSYLVNYSNESSTGAFFTPVLPAVSSGIAIPADQTFGYSAEEVAGQFVIADRNASFNYTFSLPGAYRVAMNPAHTVIFVMTRNDDNLYRVLRLNTAQTPPAGATNCQPITQPVYCLLPVGSSQADGTVSDPNFHRPQNIYFSPDGAQAYILSCGRECGGTGADAQPEVSFANTNTVRIDYYPTSATYTTPVVATVPVGGATVALSDGTNVYVAGQQLLADGYFSGVLSVLPVATPSVTATYSISDGTHTKMLFADDSTLWIGSQNCASGENAAKGRNANCLTRYDIAGAKAAVVPAVTPGSSTATVPYPNENLDPYYYGDLTGLCWVESLHKVYTAYGGQVHAFNTVDGSEINNANITVQGTAKDVAYMDASTNVVN